VEFGRKEYVDHVEAELGVFEHGLQRRVASSDTMALAKRLGSCLVLIANRNE
jgi:hypothetical protein